jgi:tetratricopeptide (TPR) repeat protein
MSDYARSFKHERVEEAISVFEEILELRPLGYGQRDEAVSNLGGALYLVCCYNKADSTRAHRSVELLREALRLRPSSHPLRDQALHKLAKCLTWLCSQGDLSVTVLTESICLGREVLQLRPVGHPERDNALGDLASALMSLFEHCGDPTFMLECLSLNREALQLRKPGHPRRPMSLNNLANALWKLASFQGGLERLAEADSLLRELLELSPPGHIMRVRVLDNLANSLGTRYELQALPASLSESIALRRQAREILTEAHPEYTRIIHNLAESLVADFRARHQLSSVTEAIGLFRRSLLLRPLEDPTRHYSLECLAEALLANFDECKDTVCLLEAIALQREVLNLRPRGHALRPVSLQRLGRQLCRREVCSWDEALALFREASEFCLAGSAACASLLSDMSVCFLDPSSPFFDLSAGISCLSDGYADELSHVNQRLGQAVSDLRRVETAYTLSTKDTDASTRASYNERVMDLHAQVIGLLPRVANFGLDHKTRLQVITGSDEVARNAAARALRLGCIPKAMEFLEAGRGIFWSQTLYLRSTEFDGVPGHDRETLIRLLQMLEYGARTAVGFDQTVAQREEAMEKRRQLNEEAETLISKIRTYPGCTRFLLPAAFNNLFEGLPDGFVVVLNTSKVAHHALLLNKATGLAASVELEPPPTGFDFAALRAGLPRDMDAQLALLDESPARAMRLDWGLVSSFDIALSQLWSSIVHPVIRALGLDVSFLPFLRRYHKLTVVDRKRPAALVHGFGGASQGS